MLDRIGFELVKDKLRKDGKLQIKIVSDSMEPILKVSETFDVDPLPQKLQIFDLVVFYQSQKLNCHFLWRDQKEFNNSIVTRSLKNPQHDDVPVTYDCLLGIVLGKKLSILQTFSVLIRAFLKK